MIQLSRFFNIIRGANVEFVAFFVVRSLIQAFILTLYMCAAMSSMFLLHTYDPVIYEGIFSQNRETVAMLYAYSKIYGMTNHMHYLLVISVIGMAIGGEIFRGTDND